MSEVLVNLTVHARGEMATKLLEAAEELGLSPLVIKTTSEGFRVPQEVHAHLFPSAYEEAPAEEPDTRYDEYEFAELREIAKARDLSAGGSADEIRARLRADDDSGE